MESDEIALNHYQSRLKASTFGAWNAWLSTEKIEIARNECEALTFSHNRCLEAVVNRFISNVYQANKRKYNLILGYTMHRLLLTRRCLQCLGRFVHRKRFTPSKLQRNLIANFTYNHSAKLRLYHRYRQKVIRRLHFRKEVYQALRDPTSCWCVLARSALQQWTCSTAKSIQDRTLLSKSAVLCKRAVKRRFLRHWLLSSCTYKEDRALEQVCEQVYYRIQTLRRVLKRLTARLRNSQQGEKRRVTAEHTNITQKHRRSLLYLWRRALSKKRVMKDAAVLCAFSSGKAKRRVFVQLLRLLKIRHSETAPLQSRVAVHVMHMWAFRRKSEMWLQWQCQYQRWRLEQRRTKIAAFNYRHRTLKASFHIFTTTLTTLRTQRNKRLIGECAVYRKCAHIGMQALHKRQLIAKIATINNYKAMLCYKYYRCLRGLHALRLYANRRKYKRTLLRDAHVSFALAHRKAACVEFLHVALDAPLTADAQHVSRADKQLLTHVFGVWKGLRSRKSSGGHHIIRKGDVRNVYSTVYSVTPSKLTTCSNADSENVHSATPVALSHAKPRFEIPAPLPLPVSHKEALLGHKYLPHVHSELHLPPCATPAETAAQLSSHPALYTTNTTHHTAGTEHSPYAYLSVSTALPRPPHMAAPPQPPPLHARVMPKPSPTSAVISSSRSCSTEVVQSAGVHSDVHTQTHACAAADSKVSFHKLQDPVTALLVSDILKTLQECKQLLY